MHIGQCPDSPGQATFFLVVRQERRQRNVPLSRPCGLPSLRHIKPAVPELATLRQLARRPPTRCTCTQRARRGRGMPAAFSPHPGPLPRRERAGVRGGHAVSFFPSEPLSGKYLRRGSPARLSRSGPAAANAWSEGTGAAGGEEGTLLWFLSCRITRKNSPVRARPDIGGGVARAYWKPKARLSRLTEPIEAGVISSLRFCNLKRPRLFVSRPLESSSKWR